MAGVGGGTWLRRGLRAWRRRPVASVAVSAALLLAWALLPRSPAAARHTHRFPGVRADVLAHYLADFSNHVLLYPHPESWTIETEWSNVTSWRYEVSYSCGERCAGRAVVSAHAHGTDVPRHGPGGAPRHRVSALNEQCTPLLPLLVWPTLCEETETEVLVVAEEDGSGSSLMETAYARCSPLATLLSRCVGAAELVTSHQLRLRSLTTALIS